jgi:hypothetical protein
MQLRAPATHHALFASVGHTATADTLNLQVIVHKLQAHLHGSEGAASNIRHLGPLADLLNALNHRCQLRLQAFGLDKPDTEGH